MAVVVEQYFILSTGRLGFRLLKGTESIQPPLSTGYSLHFYKCMQGYRKLL